MLYNFIQSFIGNAECSSNKRQIYFNYNWFEYSQSNFVEVYFINSVQENLAMISLILDFFV